jgi:hypothetical protein
LNFQLRWAEILDQKKSVLLRRMKQLEEAVADGERRRLDAIEGRVGAARPANSSVTLASLQELRSLLEGVMNRAASGADRVGEMLESLELRSVRGLKFETMNRLSEVNDLKKKFISVDVSFDSLTKFLENAADVLKSQSDAWKTDRDNLVILAQYPLAKKTIRRMLEEQPTLALARLPYEKRAAALYARLYSTGNPDVEYDETGERLVLREGHA